jgi:alpha-galactosidase
MDLMRDWIGQIAGKQPSANAAAQGRHSVDMPFSFQCGGRSSRDWLKPGGARAETGDWKDGKRVHLLRWQDTISGIACELELSEFKAFPAMEWVIRLRNEGTADSGPVSEFKALEVFWKSAKADEMPELRRSFGSDGREDDFQYQRDDLRQSMWQGPRTIRMDSAANAALRKTKPTLFPIDDRPSATWLPFFNLRTGADGIIGALGWSGQWFAEFAHDGSGKTGITAGMEHLNTRLHPGETIRSPRILVLYWSGEPVHAHNVLRQFIRAFHCPQEGGKPVPTPICNGTWGGMPTQGHLDMIAKIVTHKLPYDYYWVDAGWYGTCSEPCPDVFKGKWWIVGDWRVNPNYHPDGLKPISDAAHKAGMKFLLWFEPERAKHGTPATLEHPEWFLKRNREPLQEYEDLLLNLGHPGAWNYIVETVSSLITETGVECYREDFNFDPGPYWKNTDEDGREGVTEMRFVEGLYAFWDELRRRHPGLLIDNCASGGRRIELEMLGRSHALWRSDYNCFPYMKADASQVHTLGISPWIPMNSVSPLASAGDTYQVRSAFSAGLVFSVDEFALRKDSAKPDYPWDWHRRMMEEAKRIRPCFGGDFYPLTPCAMAPESWAAFQLLLPETGEGAVLAFRRSESPIPSANFQLQGLCPDRDYECEDADTGKTWRMAGKELMDSGLPLDIGTPRGSRLLFYRAL